MKKETTGKRFTKQTTISLNENDLLDTNIVAQGFSEMKGGITFDRALSYSKKAAKIILNDKLLPTTVYIHQILQPDNTIKETFTNMKPDPANVDGIDVLPDYLHRVKGLPRDSIECLAAEVLYLVDEISTNPDKAEIKYLDVFRLGQTTEILRVYIIENKIQSNRGRGYKNKLTPIIKRLAKQKGSAKELWLKLETFLDNNAYHPDVYELNGMPVIEYEGADEPYTFKAFSNRVSEFRNIKEKK